METPIMNDIQAVDNYIEKCRQFVNPYLLRDITNRGLYHVINFLPSDIAEAKAIARARMAKLGKAFGDDEIDQIANTIQRIEFLRDELTSMQMTECDQVLTIIEEMKVHCEFVKNYYKENKYLKNL